MIKSMTGFGRGSVGRGKNKIDVEIRSVNSRFLELKLRGINLEPLIEHEIRKLIDATVIRGSLQIRIDLNSNYNHQKISFNNERFELIQSVLKNIHVKYGQRMSLSDIITTHDLLKTDDPASINQKNIIKALSNAINQLIEMRAKEGKQIYDDIVKRINNLTIAIDNTEKIAKTYKNKKQDKLHSTISDLLNTEKIDENRLIQEVAYLSERTDVTEEIVRCRSHFEQLNYFLKHKDPVGKRINFLIQEIGREINTIGSKSLQIEITKNVVQMKDELEKIREQVQNIL